VAVEVVVQARLRIRVLAGEAQRRVRRRIRVPRRRPPQRAPRTPGDAAALVQQLRRRTHQIRGNREEPRIDLRLRRLIRDPLGLRQRPPTVRSSSPQTHSTRCRAKTVASGKRLKNLLPRPQIFDKPPVRKQSN
jgi:hypothetical protein